MNALVRFLKIYHVLIIVTFLLPFMTVECFGPSAEELEAQRIADSSKIADSLKMLDSLTQKISEEQPDTTRKIIAQDSTKSEESNSMDKKISDSSKNEPEVLEKLAEIVFRKGNNYTGLGIMYLAIVSVREFIGIFNSFILIFLSSIFLYKQKSCNYKRILLIDFIGFIFLSAAIFNENLWGYWVCFSLWIGLLILDLITLVKYKKSESNTQYRK